MGYSVARRCKDFVPKFLSPIRDSATGTVLREDAKTLYPSFCPQFLIQQQRTVLLEDSSKLRGSHALQPVIHRYIFFRRCEDFCTHLTICDTPVIQHQSPAILYPASKSCNP